MSPVKAVKDFHLKKSYFWLKRLALEETFFTQKALLALQFYLKR